MDVALLNQRIVFQKNTVVTDAIGNHKSSWTNYSTCAATIGGESGKEIDVAGTTVENTDITFTVRFCAVVDAVTEDGFRISFRDTIYNIIGIDHMNYKHKSVKFRCQRVRR